MAAWQQQQQMIVLHVQLNWAFATGSTRVRHNLLDFQNHFPLKWAKFFRFGSELQRKNGDCRRRRFQVVASAAQYSNSFSLNFGVNSQDIKSRDLSQIPWVGPLPGDIAEVEAYCRIFRAAEWLHHAMMEALCNPVTGECSISYDVPSEDRPLLEDKIVSVLGCMVYLLNKGREDVLLGRSSAMGSFRESDINVMEDKLPPLATFRGEMKRYCESLHVALEDYLTPDDAQSADVWRNLQKLKNVCYDSGFPRSDGEPSHTLFANWGPVYLSASKEDMESNSEVAFWKGGQVTEDGLKWLMRNGFKTIIDLRAEPVKDVFYETLLHKVVSARKIELIELPVDVGTSPSMKQVEVFAALVSDSSKRPIYLHSKEGVWRTSAMVSRWRQYILRYKSQNVSNNKVTSMYLRSRDDQEKGEAHTFSSSYTKLVNGEIDSTSNNLNGTSNSSMGSESSIFRDTNKQHLSSDTACLANKSNPNSELLKPENEELTVPFWLEVKPLQSQLPPSNFLSRKEMSAFFCKRNKSPMTYFNFERTRLLGLAAKSCGADETIKRYENNGNFTVKELAEIRRPNVSVSQNSSSSNPVASPVNHRPNIIYNESSSFSNGTGNLCVHASDEHCGPVNSSNGLDKDFSPATITEERKFDAATSSSDGEQDSFEGNMCASATGVVRIQSRKKAEMFLVRTDGFSCNREKVTESSLAFTHPSTQQQMLMWKSPPKTVLLLKKLGQELMEEAKQVASFLYHEEGMNVLVEPDVHDIFARIPGFGFVQTFYSQDTSDLHERVDFVTCLGGDGVILHASNLFRGAVPPVVSFNLGSLGFLTSHSFVDYKKDLRQIIHGNNSLDGVYITLRMRLRCEIFRNGKAVPGKVFDVLNEIVVDRGSNPYLSKIECYEHDSLITKVQGDGVIVATPTGSTAYSTAAGGSMVHPNVPCMLFTPICPHSLSFRPVILPDSARLELKIPEDARSSAWVSFDGKRRQQLSRRDSVTISMSQHPLPTVNKCDQTGDWFHSLIRCLNWNERLDQKAL